MISYYYYVTSECLQESAEIWDFDGADATSSAGQQADWPPRTSPDAHWY